MKILCVGGAGYIGSHLADMLNEKGHDVRTLDNLSSAPYQVRNIKNAGNFRNIDIRDKRALEDFFGGFKPSVIFHLAAVSRTPWAIEDPIYTYETNVVGTANLLEVARNHSIDKVVLASSNIVYAAQTPYKTSKLAMEQVARDYNDLYDLPTVCLRFSNVAGGDVTRQHDDNVLKSLAKSKKENGYIQITGNGEQTRNFTNVNDICEALWSAAGSEARGTEIDILHPKVWSLNEIAKLYDCEVKYVPDRKGDVKHLKMEIGTAKAKELIGFEATKSLEEYISDYTNL